MNRKEEENQRIRLFLNWLDENGAKFPKLSWPRNDTKSGIRGVIALEDIPTYDYTMLQIPVHLMMTPVNAMNDSIYGPLLKNHIYDLLYGDFLLAVFIMIELVKGKSSFYYPYLNILPEPSCLSEWTEEELYLLQDDRLFLRAKNKKSFLRISYERIIKSLNLKYPQEFSLYDFTFSRFAFAWNTIQARAFGRRLPWTALVPFADCLNHTNVQTKYDYHMNENGLFRLFPTGSNQYKKGDEVFNSYGRRPNENLLLDYGFSMLDNEWDEIEVSFILSEFVSPTSSSNEGKLTEKIRDEYYDVKCEIFTYFGFSVMKMFLLHRFFIPFQTLTFLRILYASPEIMDIWKEKKLAKEQREQKEKEDQPKENILERLERLRKERQEQVKSNPFADKKQHSDEEGTQGGNSTASFFLDNEEYHLFRNIYSVENEIEIFQSLQLRLQDILYNQFASSIEEDEILYNYYQQLFAEERKLDEEFSQSSISSSSSSVLAEKKYDALYDKFRDFLKEYFITEMSEKFHSYFSRDEFQYDPEEEKDKIEELKEKRRVQEEEFAKLSNHLLSSGMSNFIGHSFSALVYRLTRKRLLQELIALIQTLLEYARKIIEKRNAYLGKKNEVEDNNAKDNDDSSDEGDHFGELDPMIEQYYQKLVLPLNDCHRKDNEQYISRLKLYMVSLYEKALVDCLTK